METIVVGVDIGKARLDAYCLKRGGIAFGHDAAGVARLVAWLEPGTSW